MPARNPIRAYTLLIVIILIPINTYWNVQMELVRYSGLPTTISLFFNVVFNLLTLSLLNAWVRRLWKKPLLNQGELATIYIMLSIGSACSSHGVIYCFLMLAQAVVSLPVAETANTPVASTSPLSIISLMSSSARATLKTATSSTIPLTP